MVAFATAEDVQGRLDFTLGEYEITAVEGELEGLSEEARYYAGQEWPLADDPPNLVKTTLVRAVARWARNMDGLVVSKGGDEQVGWKGIPQEEAGSATFSAREISLITNIGQGRRGTGSFGTITVQAYGPRDGGYNGEVPVQGSPCDIPFYNMDRDGW